MYNFSVPERCLTSSKNLWTIPVALESLLANIIQAAPEGNHRFVVYVEDHGEPGAGTNEFWIEVRDKNGNIVVLSMADPAESNAEILEGENIVVPHSLGLRN